MTSPHDLLKQCRLLPIPADKPDERLHGRLKILWFEDRRAIDLSPRFAPYFQNVQAFFPEPAADLLREESERVDRGLHAAIYDLPFFPFDAYVADRKLDEYHDNCGALRQYLGLSASSMEPALASGAATVTAAGLFCATHCVIRFPRHPACVLNFTAEQRNTEAEWNLARSFAWDFFPFLTTDVQNSFYELMKQIGCKVSGEDKPFDDEMLLACAFSYRNELIRSAESGKVNFIEKEVVSLLAMVSKHRADKSLWSPDASISVLTAWGKRKFLLTSLFPEHLAGRRATEPTIFLDQVEWWLKNILAIINKDNELHEVVEKFSKNLTASHQLRRRLWQSHEQLCELIKAHHKNIESNPALSDLSKVLALSKMPNSKVDEKESLWLDEVRTITKNIRRWQKRIAEACSNDGERTHFLNQCRKATSFVWEQKCTSAIYELRRRSNGKKSSTEKPTRKSGTRERLVAWPQGYEVQPIINNSIDSMTRRMRVLMLLIRFEYKRSKKRILLNKELWGSSTAQGKVRKCLSEYLSKVESLSRSGVKANWNNSIVKLIEEEFDGCRLDEDFRLVLTRYAETLQPLDRNDLNWLIDPLPLQIFNPGDRSIDIINTWLNDCELSYARLLTLLRGELVCKENFREKSVKNGKQVTLTRTRTVTILTPHETQRLRSYALSKLRFIQGNWPPWMENILR